MRSLTQMIAKTEEEWKRQLTQEQFHIARKKGTERAFMGASVMFLKAK